MDYILLSWQPRPPAHPHLFSRTGWSTKPTHRPVSSKALNNLQVTAAVHLHVYNPLVTRLLTCSIANSNSSAWRSTASDDMGHSNPSNSVVGSSNGGWMRMRERWSNVGSGAGTGSIDEHLGHSRRLGVHPHDRLKINTTPWGPFTGRLLAPPMHGCTWPAAWRGPWHCHLSSSPLSNLLNGWKLSDEFETFLLAIDFSIVLFSFTSTKNGWKVNRKEQHEE